MKIFLDTANLKDISEYRTFIDGVTTNPSIMSEYNPEEHAGVIRKICNLVSGHVSAEVTSENYDDMSFEARAIASIHEQVCVKLPCTFDGLRLCKQLSAGGIATNMTLCFSPTQALLAAKCGATYVSPFIGRLEDAGHDGIGLIEEIADIYEANSCETEILAASVRTLQHVISSAAIGIGAITVSPKILRACFNHPLTDIGLKIFADSIRKNKKEFEEKNN